MRRMHWMVLFLTTISVVLVLQSLGFFDYLGSQAKNASHNKAKPVVFDPETERVLARMFERQNQRQKVIDETVSEVEELGGTVDRISPTGPVRSITMNGDGFSNRQLRSIQQLTDLTMLELKCPDFDDDGLKELASHVSLQGLRLSSPNFTGQGLISVATIPHLNFVQLESCSGISDEDLKALKQLRGLALHGDTVTDSTLNVLKDFKSLRTLWLNSLNITDEGLWILTRFPALTGLELAHCHGLTDFGTGKVGSLQNLKTLKLLGQNTTDEVLSEIARIKPLEFLEISACEGKMPEGLPVKNEGLRVLSELPQLKEVHVHRCPEITDESVSLLSSLTRLTKLTLDATLVSETGIEKLRKALPKTEIHYTPFKGPRFYRSENHALIQYIQLKGGFVYWEIGQPGAPITSVGLSSDNDFGDDDLESLTTLKSLNSLELKGKGFTNAAMDSLVQIRGLTWLRLEDCDITSVGLKRIAKSPVETLELVGATVDHVMTECIVGFPKLWDLELNRCELIDSPLMHAAELPGLTAIRLIDMSLEDAALSKLKNFERLRSVKLVDIRSSAAGITEISRCKALEFLHVERCELTDDCLELLSNLPNLSSIKLYEASVSDKGLEALSKLSSLESLTMVNCNVTDEGANQLKNCKSLRDLFLNESQVKAATVEALRRALPESSIYHDTE